MVKLGMRFSASSLYVKVRPMPRRSAICSGLSNFSPSPPDNLDPFFAFVVSISSSFIGERVPRVNSQVTLHRSIWTLLLSLTERGDLSTALLYVVSMLAELIHYC
jgi:hypothetical protein